jgi:uncharacterized membrane protein
MAINFSTSIVIDRQPTDVWNFIADFDNAPLWMPEINRVKHLDESEIGRGSTLQFELTGATRHQKVSYWEPGKGFSLSFKQLGNASDTSYKLESQADKTVVELGIKLKLEGIRLLFMPF